MRKIILIMLLAVMSNSAVGQGYPEDPSSAPQQTSSNPGGRFEVLQSPLAARWIFRLDRFTGQVWQYVKTKHDNSAWEEMPVSGLSLLQLSRPRFQLFTSGLAARYTFLLNTDTGETWIMVSDKRRNKDGTEYEQISWQRFAK